MLQVPVETSWLPASVMGVFLCVSFNILSLFLETLPNSSYHSLFHLFLTYYLKVLADSYSVVRNNAERAHILYPVSPHSDILYN